ncbi:hypothetical protein EVAR_95633_1 [Eumeta japonica]|uniref:ATP-dependent DNA helicase n=1 Tax=Eumeta variegata TaxID=151549 RepID=A0A4C2A861_EUMVA|nr:hypothetical protein EVAR_95633_1 [Eumeta japonica]
MMLNPFIEFYNNPDSGFNENIFVASMHLLRPIARKKNLMDNTMFYELMQSANSRQISLLNHMVNHLHTPNRTPMQVFLTGPADECSMIGAQTLAKIDKRLKQMTGNHDVPYRGLDILMIGDLRQLCALPQLTSNQSKVSQGLCSGDNYNLIRYMK